MLRTDSSIQISSAVCSRNKGSISRRISLALAVGALAVATSGCSGLGLISCCLSCATGGILAAPVNDGLGNGLDEQHPEFLAKIKAMEKVQVSNLAY